MGKHKKQKQQQQNQNQKQQEQQTFVKDQEMIDEEQSNQTTNQMQSKSNTTDEIPAEFTNELTSNQLQQLLHLKSAYAQFWNSSVFKGGYSQPPIPFDSVEHLLEQAAEIVVRVRNYLSCLRGKPIKVDCIDGTAHEFFWTLSETNVQYATSNPKQFVKELINATFKNSNGYVEDIKPNDLDKYVDQLQSILESKPNRFQTPPSQELWNKLESDWKSLSTIVPQLLQTGRKELTPLDASLLHRISMQTNSLLNSINNFLNEDLRFHSSTSSNSTTPRASTPISQTSQTQDIQMPEETTTTTTTTSVPQTPEPKEEDVNMELEKQEKQKETDEELERKRKEEEEQKNNMLKIETVNANLGKIQNQVRVLHETTDPLDEFSMEGEELKTKSKNLEKLQKTCLLYSEELFKNLLSLDSLVNLPATKKPLRKQTVGAIQSLLDDVDAVNLKLRSLKQSIDKKLKEEEEKKKAEQEQKKKEEEELQKQEQEKRKQAEIERRKQMELKRREYEERKKQEEDAKRKQLELLQEEERKRAGELRNKWESMKLKPKMEVDERSDGYLISSYIPGLNKEEIKLQFEPTNRTFTVEGIRIPNEKEEAAMRTHIRRNFIQTGNYSPEDEDLLFLKASSGRFGKFSESFKLPENVDTDSISARYENGNLLITIPKIRIARQYAQRNPYGGYFNDRDLWW